MARYTNEMRERAVRMVAEVRSEHPHETAALRHVSGLLGMKTETLRLWGSATGSLAEPSLRDRRQRPSPTRSCPRARRNSHG